MGWSDQHRAFAVEQFFKTDSVTMVLWKFKQHFNLKRHDDVPARNTILSWVKKFKSTSSAQKQKPPGRNRTVRTPENRRPKRSAKDYTGAKNCN